MTSGTHDIDDEAVALAQAEIARAAVVSRDARPVLELVVARLHVLLHARQCFAILVRDDQRVRIEAASGLESRLREVAPRHDRDGIAMTAMTERRTVSSADVLNDPAI